MNLASALDEDLEAEIYGMLSQVLADTTIVAIGHRARLIALHRRHIEMKPGEGGVFRPIPTILACLPNTTPELRS
jgi:vitamin B12/bleomycin/antimicrobial peptide transport system ATP-binding/permease protein